MPPQLPPRATSQVSVNTVEDEVQNESSTFGYLAVHPTYERPPLYPYADASGLEDPRTSSTQSLHPIEPSDGRRKLLLIYIHGFMGSEVSFQGFPAHVHSVLTTVLATTHVVHTKIYPTYRSRHKMSVARDNFSNWLVPHESDSTDVVLLGHSLGGILGAEVVLIPTHIPRSRDYFQHRILGLVAFDTPFLGMHPGVVGTGIASIFQPAVEPPKASDDDSDQRFVASASDPNYNPEYANDVKLPVRKNKWEQLRYFLDKHAGEVSKAMQAYAKSYLEFGGCLADFHGLQQRYREIRSLEDIDEKEGFRNAQGRVKHRVRFVNYYTASTGKVKDKPQTSQNGQMVLMSEMQPLDAKTKTDAAAATKSGLEEQFGTDLRLSQEIDNGRPLSNSSLHEATALEPPSGGDVHDLTETPPEGEKAELSRDLPPIPAEPKMPTPIDPARFPDADALQLARKLFEREFKAYKQAKSAREKAIKGRDKIINKRAKAIEKEEQRRNKPQRQLEKRLQEERLKIDVTLNPDAYTKAAKKDTGASRPVKDRKFCSLPSKDSKTGARDPTWVRVYMEGVDEIAAHTSLFFLSDTYARLVGDTVARVETWVQDAAAARATRASQP